MRNSHFIAIILSSFLWTACDNDTEAEAIVNVSYSQIFCGGELWYPDATFGESFRLAVGRVEGEDGFLFTGSTVSVGELGRTLIVNAYRQNSSPRGARFEFQFWSDKLPGNRNWTMAELQGFFSAGAVFSFGQGVGKVDVGLLLPIESGSDFRPSKATHLENPEGALMVSKTEPYSYQELNPLGGNTKQGLLLYCNFAGQIGRYDLIADQTDGSTDTYQTDEVVEIKNGEAILFVEAQ